MAENVNPLAPEAYPWMPDRGDGTYRNPVLYADYSDPDVIRAGDDFYLVASSFNCTPGLPILHSKDLVNWKLINHAVKNLPEPRFNEPQHGCGIWAPAIRFHAGRFWIFFPMPDEGIYVTTAADPAGVWSEPHLVQAGKGLIDPCPLWDADGRAYLVHAYAGSRAGIKHRLRVCPMAPDGSRLLGEGQIVFHQPEKYPTLEGPKFYRRNGYYYLFAPAGGVTDGWQTVLRARNVFGPYEDKIVLAQGRTSVNGPHQGAWVETRTGESWFLHFQDCDVYGRIVHLQPMKWVDDWPVMGAAGEPVSGGPKPDVGKTQPVAIPQTSDEFDSPAPGLQWQWQANHDDRWASLAARPGWLRLFATSTSAGNLCQAPNVWLQKLPARTFTVTARLDFSTLGPGGKAGLVMMGRDYSWLAVARTPEGFRIIRATCMGADRLQAEAEEGRVVLTGGGVSLRVTVGAGAVSQFSHSADGQHFVPLGRAFPVRAGNWIGAKVGLFCLGEGLGAGHADFDYFRFSKAG